MLVGPGSQVGPGSVHRISLTKEREASREVRDKLSAPTGGPLMNAEQKKAMERLQ